MFVTHNRCCGTHLSQTSHIALILLHGTQSVHGKNCRLFFSAGDQAVRVATASVAAVGSAARVLSCANDGSEVAAEVAKLGELAAELKRKEKKLLSEIAVYEAARVKDQLRQGRSAWVYRADGGLDFLNKVMAEVKEEISSAAKGVVVVLASGEEKKAGPLVVVGEATAVDEMVAKVKNTVKEVKGGGKGQKWQGKVACWQRGELDALRALVES